MRTVDIHTHLLNPQVSFERLYDRLAVLFFARQLGVEAGELRKQPFSAYVLAMVRAVRNSRYVERVCVFGVDARYDAKGRQTHRDPTVCAMTEDVLRVAGDYPDCFLDCRLPQNHGQGALEGHRR